MKTDLAVVLHHKFNLESNTLDIVSDLMSEENTIDNNKKTWVFKKSVEC